MNPLRADPTRTTTARRYFGLRVRRWLYILRGRVVDVVVREDSLRLREPRTLLELLLNAVWYGTPADQKIRYFQDWLTVQLKEIVSSTDWAVYQENGYRAGVRRVYDDMRGMLRYLPDEQDYHLRAGRQFVEDVVRTNDQELGALRTRMTSDLAGVVAAAVTEAGRVVATSLVAGWRPEETAAGIIDVLDHLATRRLLLVAHDALVRAFAEGQLTAMQRLGAAGVKLRPEHDMGLDVCRRCVAAGQDITSIRQARGLLPVHPNCLCCWSAVTA